MLNFYTTESDIRPDEIDTISSPTSVFIRKNITEVERDNGDETSKTVYVYQEAVMSKSDYAIYVAEENKANIDYIAMMSEVDL